VVGGWLLGVRRGDCWGQWAAVSSYWGYHMSHIWGVTCLRYHMSYVTMFWVLHLIKHKSYELWCPRVSIANENVLGGHLKIQKNQKIFKKIQENSGKLREIR
jgi:hypothetical protein